MCVGGRERDQDVLVTMVIRALLAWLDCQECGQKKKKWGKALMAYDVGEKEACHGFGEIRQKYSRVAEHHSE